MFTYLYFGFAYFCKYTPRFIQKALFNGLSLLLYLLDGRRKKIARINLDFAYGDELSAVQKRDIIKQCYKNLVFYIADSARNLVSTKGEILKKVRFENDEVLESVLKSGKKIIFIGAHYGNWEIIPTACAIKYELKLAVVGRKLGNDTFDKVLKQQRERFGIEMIDKNGGAKGLIRALKNGRHLGLVVDQNTATNEGILVNFFDKEARHTPAASNLAFKYNAVIVPLFVTSEDFFNFTIRFYEPIAPSRELESEQSILEMTQAQADVTEKVIRNKPDEWFWFHRRWKNRYEYIYEEAK